MGIEMPVTKTAGEDTHMRSGVSKDDETQHKGNTQQMKNKAPTSLV